ncbi:MAG: pyridine nucleotide-disulfide oxidoreductase [Bacteroidetes bacterium GWF2_42_66]|nr:MAG: pyridine nucleotide-disulfide oxidoreductase [Bacteroidetes bacterium GWA2_42_15]OFY01288.1 MAG: pyridine nucleotide-disulfide oxidoreductase [Bacteroidetes bacterium GWE2_42_39]OFY42132.1 MAG: pyridine nucleotide-disulfide oxidoreductase [Bacteroidetes bacterium GWF2_42_66]HBL77664.1 pyridine nucleotide-disulfide oxidoreductase [Prolixibacteraceae bacterium]HCB62793.1 pyridine nucleotide-disulfide oxidoreductase [Bacteroidales bacterium]
MRKFRFFILFLLATGWCHAQSVLVEAESFTSKGGWAVDQQFMDQMGSPYLLAHGLGIPVEDAATTVNFPKKGTYYLWVRTRNWASLWTNNAPGQFQVLIDGKPVSETFGIYPPEWSWVEGGPVEISNKKCQLGLHDLTGFNGRCDALFFTKDSNLIPPSGKTAMAKWRKQLLDLPEKPDPAGTFDFVVIGGGMAGTCAAISAARLGVKVALIQDRPVLGGNNSSEVRVHLGGRIKLDPYPNLGNLVNEIGPKQGGNAQPLEYYEDGKKLFYVEAEKNITLFLNYRASHVITENGNIKEVVAVNIETGQELVFSAPLFADCTGDGTIGFLAGADYMMGRESSELYNEATAPEEGDEMTMGSSVQWFAEEKDTPVAFPDIDWGLPWNEQRTEAIKRGDWNWETGMNLHQVNDFERVRDYGLLVVFSNWSYLKNHSSQKSEFKNSQMKWVAYVAGKRESRRLVGDYILKEQDITEHHVYPDGTAPTSWTIDLHYPDPKNSELFPDKEFKSIAKHIAIYPYPIPFRCLYSKNVGNLMMAGRNISVTHVALGTVRVMRTTGMMGEVVGMAAAVCKNENTNPRGVYQNHFDKLIELMKKGTGNPDLENIQKYNEGSTKLKH